jgi:glutaconyl-CoA/methylmalonyl-CoA decarboxylase subunit gamma
MSLGGFNNMKRYYVTVNGNKYEVEIEEVNGEFSPRPAAAPRVSSIPAPQVAQAPVTQAAPKAEVKEEPKPQAAQPSKPAASAADGEKIECPMPGTILKVNVSEGSTIKKGDVLFILEAMKMENEIMASRDGKIIQVAVVKGAVVNTGETLAVME